MSLIGQPVFDRSACDFRAIKSGNWGEASTWNLKMPDGSWRASIYIPKSGNAVLTEGFTITLIADSECLSIDNIGDILPANYQLTINGVDQYISSLNEIADNTFYLDLQDALAYTESGGVVEEVRNKASVGVTFPNLVTNGDFSGGVTTGWTVSGTSVLSVVSGKLRVTNNTTTNGGGNQTIPVIAGKRYRITAQSKDATSATCQLIVRGLTPTTIISTYNGVANTDFDQTFIAPTNSLEVRLINGSIISGQYTEWDNIIVEEVDAVVMPDATKRPTVGTDTDGKKYLLLDGVNDFMYGSGNCVADAGFSKVVTFEWDSNVTLLADNHIIASLVNNQHSLAIVKTNSTTARVKDGLATSAQYDLLIDRLTGQRITLIERWAGGTKEILLNGVSVATNVESQTITDFSFLLGAFNNGAASTFFKGKIFEMATYLGWLSDFEVSQVDKLQEKKFRSHAGSYYVCAGAGESVEVGYATAQPSDPIVSGAGLNYLPTLNLFRIANDVNGDSYSASLTGSKIPPLCDEVFNNTGVPVMYVQTAKGGSTVSSVSASGGADTHWGSDGNLRFNSSDKIKAMLRASGQSSLEWLVINIGENDAIYMNANPSWTKALFKAAYQDIITYFQAQFSGVKIIIVQTMNQRAYPSDVVIYAAQTLSINQAEQELVVENTNCFLDTSPSTFNITNGLCMPDGQHYSKLGNEIVGAEQGQIIINN